MITETGPGEQTLLVDDAFVGLGLPSTERAPSGITSGEIPEGDRNGFLSNTPGAPLSSPAAPLAAETQGVCFLSASDIAKALQVDKKTVHNRAKRENWPSRAVGNRIEYQPPKLVADLCGPAAPEPVQSESAIRYINITNQEARQTILRRERAVLAVESFLGPRAIARANTVANFILKWPDFQISVRSLERWETLYRLYGIDGLVDQKQGRVGRKGTEVPEEFKRRGQALAREKGSLAKAARELATHPDLPANLRMRLHDAHASKSYVTPSVRDAFRTAPLTGALLQGQRAARLASPWTPGDYANVRAGEVYVSDDMTSNVYCWCEWPNKEGWIIRQAQILPILDVGTLRWLTLRVIVRESGQYTSDDIWGLFGDVFDSFGLPARGFLLEGGHWRSNNVLGHKTGLSDEERIGGLSSLGLEFFAANDPRAKGMIEGAFNQLQYHMDAFCGYAGRDQRKQLPEAVKRQLALCKAGEHPSKYFPHVSQLADHIRTVMANLNNERQDGKILRGLSPLEKWAADAPRLSELPPEAKWMYRSAKSVTKITRNGARVTMGSGPRQQVYYYDNPELLRPLPDHMKVIVYWNDHNPDADACVCDLKGRFLGMAKKVPDLDRFGASPEQLESEARRKAISLRYARTEARAIQPHLQRPHVPAVVDPATKAVGAEIREATERVEQAEAQRKETRRQLARVELTEAERQAALSPEVSAPEENVMQKFSDLFAPEEIKSDAATPEF